MRSHPVVWVLRLCWLSLPFTVGDALGRALDGRSTPVQVIAVAIAWSVWGVVLVATLVPHPITLTILRVLAPVAPVAAIALTMVHSLDGKQAGTTATGLAGVALSLLAAACATAVVTADEYVDGASYGDERRFALRTPIAFIVGPIPLFWIGLVGASTAGPLLLAVRQWIAGVLLTAVGLALAVPAARAFHALSRRWLVFVPAGVTAVDHLGLVDPVLFNKRNIVSFGPALADTAATDLTQNALGLVLEVVVDTPVEITARTGRLEGEVRLANAVLFSVGRPGAVIQEATRRGLHTAAAVA